MVTFRNIRPFVCVLIRTGEPEPGVFGSLEPEPAEKKTRSRSRSKNFCKFLDGDKGNIYGKNEDGNVQKRRKAEKRNFNMSINA